MDRTTIHPTSAALLLLLLLPASPLHFACSDSSPAPGQDAAVPVSDADGSPPADDEVLEEDRSVYADDTLEVLQIKITAADSVALQTLLDYRAGDPEPAPVTIRFAQVDAAGKTIFDQPGTLQLRGRSTRGASNLLKSFKIRLDKEGELWRGQRNLNFNKHPWDLTRIRNKLSFDTFKEIPNFTSLRTQFTALSINGEAFGLYTFIENAGEQFLESHGLDPDGQLYKAEEFSFEADDGELLVQSPEQFFPSRLEVKAGGDDHSKLAAMIADVNNEELDIDQVIAKHFSRDNYLTWLAVNILLFNADTTSQNFFLYSPSRSSRWFFLPWDYDGALGFYEQPNEIANWEHRMMRSYGVNNWSNVVLHRRFFAKSQNIKDLTAKVDALAQTHFSAERIKGLVDAYYTAVFEQYIHQAPDAFRLPTTVEHETDEQYLAEVKVEYDAEILRLKGIVEEFRQRYHAGLEWPAPVWLDADRVEGGISFDWDESSDLQGDALTYEFQLYTVPFQPLAADPGTPGDEFKVVTVPGLTTRGYELDLGQHPLAPGEYFWRVLIRDAKGNWQVPFDQYWDEAQDIVYGGMEYIKVNADGTFENKYGDPL